MDFIFWIELVVFIILLGFSAFFSSSETALFSLDKIQIEKMRRDGHPEIGLIEKLLSSPRKLIISILIGNEFVNVSASVISASMVITVFGEDQKWLNLLIMVPILLLVGEITPKTLAIRNNVAFSSVEARPIELFSKLIKPVRTVVRFISNRVITLIIGKERSSSNIITEDLIKTLAHQAVGEGTLDSDEALLIEQIFDFGSKTVADVMTTRSDISYLNVQSTVADALKDYQQARHSKMPVYQVNRDTIIGVLYVRDLFNVTTKKRSFKKSPIKKYLRQAYFVPETKSVAELFETFRTNKLSIAFAVDEYGGVKGLVTIEDLLECIFGDIQSPSDLIDEPLIKPLSEARHEVMGSCDISIFNQFVGCDLTADQAQTIAGLLLQVFGELPDVNAEVDYEGLHFKVTKVKKNRIKRVVVEPINENGLLSESEIKPKLKGNKKKKQKQKQTRDAVN